MAINEVVRVEGAGPRANPSKYEDVRGSEPLKKFPPDEKEEVEYALKHLHYAADRLSRVKGREADIIRSNVSGLIPRTEALLNNIKS